MNLLRGMERPRLRPLSSRAVIPMADDTSSSDMSGMHGHMMVCCGVIVLYLGIIAISSGAAIVGLSTGQKYLAMGGFAIAVIASMAYLYRRSAISVGE